MRRKGSPTEPRLVFAGCRLPPYGRFQEPAGAWCCKANGSQIAAFPPCPGRPSPLCRSPPLNSPHVERCRIPPRSRSQSKTPPSHIRFANFFSFGTGHPLYAGLVHCLWHVTTHDMKHAISSGPKRRAPSASPTETHQGETCFASPQIATTAPVQRVRSSPWPLSLGPMIVVECSILGT